MTGRKLGRGLEMLITKEEVAGGSEVLQLDPTKIQPNPEQPRKQFSRNELDLLKASIAREGVLQPLLVRKTGDSYQLVAGERRLRAAQELGLEKIPAISVPVGEERLLEMALIENVQREDLNPIELAKAYRQLMQVKGWTQDALAEKLNFSRPSVSNTLRLLDLPSDIQESIARKHITMGHAKVLLSVTDPKEQRLLFERIAEEKLTVRDLEDKREEIAPPRGDKGGDRRKARRALSVSPHILQMEERLAEKLGTRVRIRERDGRGRVVIEFYSSEDFERIRDVILKGR